MKSRRLAVGVIRVLCLLVPWCVATAVAASALRRGAPPAEAAAWGAVALLACGAAFPFLFDPPDRPRGSFKLYAVLFAVAVPAVPLT